MIKATFFKDSETGTYRGFSLSGHAGYDEYGKDIICASVSALAINTVNSIEKFTGDKFHVQTDDEKGLLAFEFESAVSKESELLIDSLQLGLLGIKNDYPKENYVKIVIKEV